MISIRAYDVSVSGFGTDARDAMVAHPDYFVWWYTVKSVGLCVAVAYAAYLVGRNRGNINA